MHLACMLADLLCRIMRSYRVFARVLAPPLGLIVLGITTSCVPQTPQISQAAMINTPLRVIARFDNLFVSHLSWSPDGRSLILVERLPYGDFPGSGYLARLDISSGSVTRLNSTTQIYGWLNWSPNGKLLVAQGGRKIWLIDTTNWNMKYLLEGEGAVWSPDGQKLAIFRGPHSGGSQDNFQIVFVTTDGEELNTISTGVSSSPRPAPTLLPTEPSYHGLPPATASPEPYFTGLSWSPSGQSLVYSVVLPDEQRGDVFAINPDGSGQRRLTPAGFSTEPTWSPRGDRIAYVYSPDYSSGDLYLTTSEGKCHLRLTTTGNVSTPAWSPDGHEIAVMEATSGIVYILDAEKFITDNLDPKQCKE